MHIWRRRRDTKAKAFTNAKEGLMRSTNARIWLENLENRALLATTAGFENDFPQVVSDKVGTVDVSVGAWGDPGDTAPVTVTLTTGGGTAVPGVDYTPVTRTITLTPTTTSVSVPSTQVAIPILPGPASLGTRVLQVSLSPSPGAPQGQSVAIVITHGTDTTSPYVVSSQALTQGGKVIAFSLQFSKPMTTGQVTNLANYVAAAPKSVLQVAGTVMGPGNSITYTTNIPLKSAIYYAPTNTVYLLPVNPVKPNKINKIAAKIGVEFEIGSPNSASFSSLADTSGNPIASGNPAIDSFPNIGSFVQFTEQAKASPSVLSYLFGTPTQAKARGNAKFTHGQISRR
jgi:hypothetical protein